MKVKILVLFGVLTASAQSPTTIYIIRHAEKASISHNPDLNEDGKLRAQRWAKHFADVDFDVFYSSDYNRTYQTCAAIAGERQSEIILRKPEHTDLKQLLREHAGKTVLLVGHSNTIPKQLNALLEEQKYDDIEEDDYGNLYIVRAEGDLISDQILRPEL